MKLAALIVGMLCIALGTLGIATLLVPAADLPIPDVSLRDVANLVFPIGGAVFVLLGIGLLGWLVFQRSNEKP